LISPFVHEPVVPAAQQDQIVERRAAAIGPMRDVVGVAAA
jgi:hypothetical protein